MSRESAFVNIGTGFSSLDILQKSGVREDHLHERYKGLPRARKGTKILSSSFCLCSLLHIGRLNSEIRTVIVCVVIDN